MPALFVTGTGTDIGKTFVSAHLIAFARARGRAVHALKPVLSGFDPASAPESDAGILLAALGTTPHAHAIAAIAPWRYAAPLSPHMAAAAEGRTVPFDDVVGFCRREIDARPNATTIVEGVGGLMVPLDDRRTVADWIDALAIPTLLVTGSYLGAISHTLTCVAAMRARGALPFAILVNETADGIDLAGTTATIAAFAGAIPTIALSRDAAGETRDASLAAIFGALDAGSEERRGVACHP